MSRVFAHAKLFDRDLSQWDVSGVKDMSGMFLGATSFNGDLGKWDVSSVKDMYGMFWGASGFNRKLCGDAWVHCTAKKTVMFVGMSGSISPESCATTINSSVFSPESREELRGAVEFYTDIMKRGGER